MRPKDTPITNNSREIPHGYCQCGCGEKTRLRRGVPNRYINGHSQRLPENRYEWDEDLKCVRIHLAGNHVALVDKLDAEEISWLHWVPRESAGRSFYAQTRLNGRRVMMHRMIMDAPSGVEIDHINGNGLDNRRDNLRYASRGENSRNKSPSTRNTSGFLGVHRSQGKWRAQIQIDGRQVCIGRFDSPEEAARERDKAAIRLHGEFAWLNFPEK